MLDAHPIGIYGEMFFAAIQAAAFVEADVPRCIEIGLSEIPRDCRLARWVPAALDWHREFADLEAALDRMEREDVGRRMSPVHTIKPKVFGFQEVRMSELAERHAAVWRRIHAWHSQRRAARWALAPRFRKGRQNSDAQQQHNRE